MNSFSIFAFFLCVALCYSAPEPPKEYSTKFDDIDLDPILKSKRLISAYVQCLVQNVGCTAQGKALKGKLSTVRIIVLPLLPSIGCTYSSLCTSILIKNLFLIIV